MAYQSIPFRPSTNIAALQWDAEAKELLVTFLRGGRRYSVKGIDADTVAQMSRAMSVGQFYNTFIKDQYEIQEV